ncbi:MAG: hypothetical protein LBE81_02940 [Azonexus sp.]|jgi:hypothetical protein|uniref:hypothetical protein n=1 Tax=Azonexus sp. TaxID=1872668 RepID=UPI002831B232|nr:hypothetical protein [Azonexus sp.]MDR0775577.1 hypothetical protein [Azonexus sp.]
MDLAQLELHDANLLGVAFDPVARTADVRLAYYPNEQSSERVLGALRFTGVSQFNQLVDLGLLEEHARFGNIVQWVSGERSGVSYIYLARGLISVTAVSVELIADA